MAAAYPSTIDEFHRRFPDHVANMLHTLPRGLKNVSGSNWTIDHLRVCRVLIHPCNTLAVLEPHLQGARATIRKCSAAEADLAKLAAARVSRLCHAELRVDGGVFGAFYIALADVSRWSANYTASISLSTSRTDRPRRQIILAAQPNYNTGKGLSSPFDDTSERYPISSPYSPPSDAESEDYEKQLERTKHEAVSSDLAAQFISSVLDCLFRPRLL
jgi:hypothetical protein